MQRAFPSLKGQSFDLLIVGGGIYGAWTAYDAALRGLRVALVEREDWASGTSSASSKLIHGGLRYLQYSEFGLVRKALIERRRLSRLGPHRVHPLQFAVPVFQGDAVGPFRMRLGLCLYDLLSGFGQPVARHRRWPLKQALDSWPFLNDTGMRTAFTYGDCGTDDARLVLELVSGAALAGAVVVNHAPALDLLREGDRVVGANVVDALDPGHQVEVRANQVVLCAGPWSEDLLHRPDDARRSMRLVQGTHLVLPAMPTRDAFLLPTEDGRIFFLIPWYGRTLVGTTETDYHGDPSVVTVPEQDVEYLLRNTHRHCPGLGWQREDVIRSFTGLRALRNELHRDPSAVTREWKAERPQPGLWLPVGGKLTSARADAATLVDRICRTLGKKDSGRPTEDQPFPWAPQAPYGPWLQEQVRVGIGLGLDAETAKALAQRHGNQVSLLHQAMRDDPSNALPLVAGLPFCIAEVDHARAFEMAMTDDDLWRRRIPLHLLASEAEAAAVGRVRNEA